MTNLYSAWPLALPFALVLFVIFLWWVLRPTEEKLLKRLQSATTLGEYLDIYHESRSGSVAKRQAADRFISLGRSRLERATAFPEALEIYESLDEPSGGALKAFEQQCLEKCIDLIGSTEDALELFEFETDPQTEDRILRKALELARTPQDAEMVFDSVSADAPLEHEAMKRQLELTTTLEEVEEVLSTYGLDSDYGRLAILRAAEIVQATGD